MVMGNHSLSKVVVLQNNDLLFVEPDVVFVFKWERFSEIDEVL